MANRLISTHSLPAPRRIALPRPDVPDLQEAGQSVRRTARGRVMGVPLRDLIWQLIWSPYWVGSDVPAPVLPRRDPAPTGALGPAGEQVVRTLDSIVRRLWLQWLLAMVVRGAWLALAVGCAWLLAENVGAPPARAESLFWLVVALAVVGLVFGLTLRPSRQRTAQMLDRSFGLHERIGTAYTNLGRDVPQPGERPSVVYLQVADSANIIAELRKEPALGIHPPVREIVLGLTIGLLLTALSFYRGVGGEIPSTSAVSVPQFVPASERIAEEAARAAADQTQGVEGELPSLADIEEMARRSNEAEQNLSTLGAALADHSMTEPAAANIADGDYPGAAEDLQSVGESADQMSPGARSALADDLDQAAEQMSPGDQELADAARQAADGLREGGQAATEGMDSLANEVEQTGSEVMDQEDLAQQRAAAAARESQSGETASQASESQPESGAPAQDSQSGTSPESQQGNSAQSGDEAQDQEGQSSEPGGEQAGQQASDSQDGGQQVAAAPDEETAGGSPQEADGSQAGEQAGTTSGSQSESGQTGEQEGGPNSPGAQQGPERQGGSEGQPAGSSTIGGGQPLSGDQTAPPPEDVPLPPALPATERVSGPDGTTSEPPAETPEPGQDQEGVVSLEGSHGTGVQTGSNPGQTTSGNGTGSTTASGSATQGEVGEAGPDSNRVPPEYRDVVEAYFTTEGD